MEKDRKTTEDFLIEIEGLQIRLDEAEETLAALRRGDVDGLVVSAPGGDQVFTLKGAESSYRLFVESMNEGAVTLSFDGTVLYCNDRFAEMVETSGQKIIGTPVYQFIASPGTFEPAFRKGKSEPSKAEVLLKRENDGPMPVSISFNPMMEDEAPGLCMVVTDLTEQVRQGELLKQRAEQLTRLLSQLTLAEQRERRRLAMILHDHLQQLLVGAKIHLEVLEQQLGRDFHRTIEPIHILIMDSLKTSRSLNSQLAPQILYERGLAEGLEWLARTMGETYKLVLETDMDQDVAVEREDVNILLFESVRELLFNVVKHARTLSARLEMKQDGESYLRISISDQGIGFDPGKLDENLDQGDHFGLFSIRERLALLGGRLEIESSPGLGAAFHLIVPAEGAAVRRTPPGSGEIPAGEAFPAQEKRKIRVLLVDDHIVMRQGLSSLLGEHSDMKVVGEAADGEEAVQLARKLQPEVILMDISMPRMNGLEATRVIHAELPPIRIIGLSMHDDAETEKGMLAAGAAAFVTKTGHPEDLLAVIRQYDKKRTAA